MSDWTTGFVESNGIRLHYTRTGGDQPPLVLAHGYSDDGLCWTPVARALEAEFDVVMLDARFHGRSDGPKQDFDTGVMADDLAGAIRALALPAPIVLGHSMGAATALILAGRYPDLPGAIALEDPPPHWSTGREPPGNHTWLARERDNIARLQRQSRESIMAAKHLESPVWPLDELGPWADSKLRFNPAYFDYSQPLALNWDVLLPQLTCDVLLLTADPALGAIVSDQQAAALGAYLPQLRRAHIAGAGHNIRREQFAAYLAAVRAACRAWRDRH